ncbi:hypothetical protein PoB_005285100 [Plakobranchus ocellatus]|uniref:Uncharacterized protein n=1 Tax=Plakobranchus ocellatus TaxID=259542 RepID=A0AAV4C0R1_9GAST|nr:hypothetical protein PoB_005285100 [Plakobranchus ocellatus]
MPEGRNTQNHMTRLADLIILCRRAARRHTAVIILMHEMPCHHCKINTIDMSVHTYTQSKGRVKLGATSPQQTTLAANGASTQGP